jgi:hypothetical protein
MEMRMGGGGDGGNFLAGISRNPEEKEPGQLKKVQQGKRQEMRLKGQSCKNQKPERELSNVHGRLAYP